MDVALALLESAPDRECAELCLLVALGQGIDGDQMKVAWDRWTARHARAVRRGEESQ